MNQAGRILFFCSFLFFSSSFVLTRQVDDSYVRNFEEFWKTWQKEAEESIDQVFRKDEIVPENLFKHLDNSNPVDSVQGGITGVVDGGIHDPFMTVDLPKPNPPPSSSVDNFPPPSSPVDYFPPSLRNFFQRRTEWWNRPNVCVDREEIDEGNETSSGFPFMFQHTNCFDTESAHKCTTSVRSHGIQKTYIVTYHCCHGYDRKNFGDTCEKVKLESLMDTMRNAGGKIFADLIAYSGLEDAMKVENVTVFCPTDLALETFHEDYENNVVVMIPNGVQVQRRSVHSNDNLVLAHVVNGLMRAATLMDEQLLQTQNPKAKLRVNVYNLPHRKMTVNCAQVISANNFATNGVVHMTNRVLPPVEQTLEEIVLREPKYSIFKSLLEANKVLDTLRQNDANDHFTVLVPTDEAFHKMDPGTLQKMMNGELCVAAVLKYHILPNVVCENVLPLRSKSVTLQGSDVRFRRDEERLLVNDIDVAINDQTMATNGVLYPIEGVLIPSEGKQLISILDEYQLTDLIDLLEELQMKERLNSMKNFTFFAPTNRAIRQARPILNEIIKSSPEKARDIVMYHTAHPQMKTCQADNNHLLKSGLSDKSIRFNHFPSLFHFSNPITAQCAKIVQMDAQVCDGSVQFVERVLLPPEGHLGHIVASNQSYSIFRKLLRRTELEKEISEHGPYTLLVPTDNAFYQLREEVLDELFNNKEKADAVMRNHILPELLCCAAVPQDYMVFTERVRALSGDLHMLRRNRRHIYIGAAQVAECDIMADNGVVHSINSVIMPENRRNSRRRQPFTGFDYRHY